MKIYFIENRFILFEYQNMFLLIQKKSVFNKICFHYKFFLSKYIYIQSM